MKAAGVRCVIAKSFSRHFYRGGINMGILPLICRAEIREGDLVEVDLEKSCIRVNGSDPVAFEPFPPQVVGYLTKGGLLGYYKKATSCCPAERRRAPAPRGGRTPACRP